MRMTATIVEHMPATLLGIWQISFNPYDTSIRILQRDVSGCFLDLSKKKS